MAFSRFVIIIGLPVIGLYLLVRIAVGHELSSFFDEKEDEEDEEDEEGENHVEEGEKL